MKNNVQLLGTHAGKETDIAEPCFLPIFLLAGLWGNRGGYAARGRYGGFPAGRGYGGFGAFSGRGYGPLYGYYSPYAMRRGLGAYGYGAPGFGYPGIGRWPAVF